MREDYKELVTSMGWKKLVEALEEKKRGYVGALVSAGDWEKVIRFQAAISELNYVIRLPHEFLQGDKHDEEG